MGNKPERNLRELFNTGVKDAVAKALAEHKRNGQAIVISKDGKVIKVPANEIKIDSNTKE